MTRPKIESGLPATSTTGGEAFVARPLPWIRRLVLLAICGAALAWLSGPAVRLLVALPLLLLAPGYLLEQALKLPATLYVPRLALWMGLSLSMVALLYEWATCLGFVLTPVLLGGLALLCALAVIARLWWQLSPLNAVATSCLPIRISLPTLLLLIIFCITLGVRLYQIRDLALPAWVDSVHHALMIRVAVERGQAPTSLRPYLPVDQLPYHWGYHVFLAALVQLSGLNIPRTMLWTGQMLNALQGVALAGSATYLWRRPLAGVLAAVVAGLFSIFPAYYASWGRYTQLTGLLLLPALLVAWLELLRMPGRRWMLVLAVLLAGLSLIHFVVLAFALVFMLVSGIMWLCSAQRRMIISGASQAVISALLAMVLAGPWLWLLTTRFQSSTTDSGRAPTVLGNGSYFKLDIDLLLAGHNRILIGLALLAALWALRQHWRVAVQQVAWVAALVVLADMWLLPYILPVLGLALVIIAVRGRHTRFWRYGLLLIGAILLLLNPLWSVRPPYFALVSIEAVVISLFLPLGVLIGGGGALLCDLSIAWLQRSVPRQRRYVDILAAVALVGLALYGAWDSRTIINPSTVFAMAADVQAIDWAATHTPADARFLINAAVWLGTGRGNDGGWWLLPLAGRWTSTPPVLYDYAPSDYTQSVRERTQQVITFQPGQESELYAMIKCEQITYIYLGPHAQPLTIAQFPASQGFVPVYEQDGVTILAVRR